jgi:structural maintenance of chromosomes protein 6
LRNQGKDAYKPLVYGKTIIIERKIDKNSSSNYKIKDEFGKVQEKTRTELQLILNQFNIHIDNPCTIMTQDISRKFLGSTNPKDKYSVRGFNFNLNSSSWEQLNYKKCWMNLTLQNKIMKLQKEP